MGNEEEEEKKETRKLTYTHTVTGGGRVLTRRQQGGRRGGKMEQPEKVGAFHKTVINSTYRIDSTFSPSDSITGFIRLEKLVCTTF